ncbi:MAG: hypothetical protein NZO16_04395 [Deltaproteobacteria bacterium]|nr:hypothetical protein [Deltaproteobacteria bacterium]
MPSDTTEITDDKLRKILDEIPLFHKMDNFVLAVFSKTDVLASSFRLTNFKDVSSSQNVFQMVFDVGELTKVFSTVLLLKLCEEKKIPLECLIGEYINFFSSRDKENLRILDLLRGEKLFAKFTPHLYLESLNLDLRPGLYGSRYAKKTVFFELCRLPLEVEKHGDDNLNFLVVEELIELLSSSGLESVMNKFLLELVGINDIGFVNLQRVSRSHRSLLDMSFVDQTLLRKHSNSAKDCVSMGGICGYYGILGRLSSILKFFRIFLSNLDNPGPLIHVPLLSLSRYIDSEKKFFFFECVEDLNYTIDLSGACFGFNQKNGLGLLLLVNSDKPFTRDEARVCKNFLASLLNLF